MAKINYYIEIDSSKNAVVKPDENDGYLLDTDDSCTFSSNRADTIIRYVKSPFTDLASNKILTVGKGKKGPFKIGAAGKKRTVFHFECGRMNGGEFTPWGGGGNGTPVGH